MILTFRATLLGKVIRIDINGSSSNLKYAIPKTNPYFGHSTFRQEIYAYGIRNIWRCDVDEGDPNTGNIHCNFSSHFGIGIAFGIHMGKMKMIIRIFSICFRYSWQMWMQAALNVNAWWHNIYKDKRLSMVLLVREIFSGSYWKKTTTLLYLWMF